MVDFLEYEANSIVPLMKMQSDKNAVRMHVLEASVAMRSKISLTNEFKIAMALLEIPVSG